MSMLRSLRKLSSGATATASAPSPWAMLDFRSLSQSWGADLRNRRRDGERGVRWDALSGAGGGYFQRSGFGVISLFALRL
jgi:hypothetical protein